MGKKDSKVLPKRQPIASCSTTVESAATAVLPATAAALQVATAHTAAHRPAVDVGSTPAAELADEEDLDGAGEVAAPARNLYGKRVRKPAIRFTIEMDIALMKEVISIEPFKAKFGETAGAWVTVANNVNNTCCLTLDDIRDGPQCSKRLDALRKWHKDKDASALRQSGTEEELTERDTLADSLFSEMDDLEEKRNSRAQNEKATRYKRDAAGADVVEAAMTTLGKRTQVTADGLEQVDPDLDPAVNSKRSRQGSGGGTVIAAIQGMTDTNTRARNEQAKAAQRRLDLDEKRQADDAENVTFMRNLEERRFQWAVQQAVDAERKAEQEMKRNDEEKKHLAEEQAKREAVANQKADERWALELAERKAALAQVQSTSMAIMAIAQQMLEQHKAK
ncbi:hypothetical protein DFJ73DRAFT_944587 [Zopfochytrium polystomum]|nr:hypothetical protein DFJ73DRAFT_944587 [Zopfochytrium polystomum]